MVKRVTKSFAKAVLMAILPTSRIVARRVPRSPTGRRVRAATMERSIKLQIYIYIFIYIIAKELMPFRNGGA